MSGYNPYPYNPYQPPQPVQLPKPYGAGPGAAPYPEGYRPAVWWWYVAYCIGMSLLYMATTLGGAAMLAFSEQLAEADREANQAQWVMLGVVMAAMGIPLAIIFGVAPLLPKRKWAWIYGIVMIALGLTSACTMPASIPLLVFWLKDDTKHFYRV